MISQPNIRTFSLFQFGQQLRDIESRTNIKVRLIKREIKLEDSASRPGGQVYVMGHRKMIVPKLVVALSSSARIHRQTNHL
jgi:hypothetical protein